MVVTNEMIEAAKQKGRDLSGGMPGAFQEACAEIALAGLTAALAVAPGVEVKPLRWRKLYEDSQMWPITWHGSGLFGTIYPVEQYSRNQQFYSNGNGYDTLEAAKSAAQADYTARIMSALATTETNGHE